MLNQLSSGHGLFCSISSCLRLLFRRVLSRRLSLVSNYVVLGCHCRLSGWLVSAESLLPSHLCSIFTSFLQQRWSDVRFREHASLFEAFHCCGEPRIRTSGQLVRASGCCQRYPSQHAALSFISALVGTTSLLPLASGQATTCGLLFIPKQVCSFACDLRDCSLRVYTNAKFCLNGGGDCFHL